MLSEYAAWLASNPVSIGMFVFLGLVVIILIGANWMGRRERRHRGATRINHQVGRSAQ
jgi:hypothetical protein